METPAQGKEQNASGGSPLRAEAAKRPENSQQNSILPHPETVGKS